MLIALKRISDIEGLMIVVMTALSAFMLFETRAYPRMASEFPRIVLAITLAMCLYLLVGRLWGKLPPSKVKGMGKQGPAWWLFSLALFAYFAGMQVIGFLPATFLLLVLVPLWVSGKTQGWLVALIYGLGITVVFYAGMTYMMQIPIPPGLLPFFK
jgi:hypothetical protein